MQQYFQLFENHVKLQFGQENKLQRLFKGVLQGFPKQFLSHSIWSPPRRLQRTISMTLLFFKILRLLFQFFCGSDFGKIKEDEFENLVFIQSLDIRLNTSNHFGPQRYDIIESTHLISCLNLCKGNKGFGDFWSF